MVKKSSTGKTVKTDVAIIGGGHAGCTLAALLAAHDIDVVCIDQENPQHTLNVGFDGRTTAISYGSQKVIAAAGAWDYLEDHACPIRDIQISESGSPVLLRFLAEDIRAPAMGWILENRILRQSLYKRLSTIPAAQHIAPARVRDFTLREKDVVTHLEDGRDVQAKLAIGADGRHSFTREWMGISTRGWTYRQRAVVFIIHHENPHNFVAVEDFRSEGPFAILPMMDDDAGRHRSSVVWTEHGIKKASALYWSEPTLNAALNERCPSFYGRVALAGKRFSYPLSLSHAQSYIGERMALIADAAHGIHPIAGQGLNLGLRDIASLSELLIETHKGGGDPGNADLLQSYQRSRSLDNMIMAGATDCLNKLFSNDSYSVRIMRKIGLSMVQEIPSSRRFFMRQAMGAGGLLPNLIKTGKFHSS